ncbi:amino acid adenylation domain-containing protein [Paenibacillus sp. sgz500992]|uniref:amino acid adenylation domain-containing protein n=1 Tax=Paenibacillus sp. sgz500992 TaxID=3242476 RepID=UPI0036D2F911
MSKEQSEQDISNDIAIVSMVCRFPGVDTVEQYWELLASGTDALQLSPAPAGPGIEPLNRLGTEGLIPVNTSLKDTEKFDAAFFKLTSREAEITDPQHRLFMENAWKVLEKAGYNPLNYPGLIGLFAGVSTSTYLINHLLADRDRNESVSDLQLMIANDKDHMTAQIAYRLNICGPVVAVQTSCSTSLVATHLACESLLSGQCDLALAGGVTLKFPQVPGYLHRQGGLTAADGMIHAFDAEATGTVYSNGLGIVVLKRLEDALRDGDMIQAVIKGSAINSDGANRIGYAAPGVDGQAAVIAEAMSIAQVQPDAISYVEAHGSGTPLGDDIELEALSRAFAAARSNRFCAIGSAKTNIGHVEMASGAAGLIKTALALKHRKIPASLHFETPNPKLEEQSSPFYVNDMLADWDAGEHGRYAGISSFGLGGINAHLVLTEAPVQAKGDAEKRCELLVLSAKTASALERMCANMAAHIEIHPQLNLSDLAYTLKTGRAVFAVSKAIVFRGRTDLLEQLRAASVIGTTRQGSAAEGKQAVCLSFSQSCVLSAEEARDLYESSPTFQQLISELSDQIRRSYPLDLRHYVRSALAPEPSSATARMLSFALQLALGRLFLGWGIQASSIVGTGIGDWVRQVLKGECALEDALHQPYSEDKDHTSGHAPVQEEQVYVLNLGKPSQSDGQIAAAGQVPGLYWLQSEIARLWLAGAELDWVLYYEGERRRKLELPTYPFERGVFWIGPSSGRATADVESGSRQGNRMADNNYYQQKVKEIWEQSLGLEIADGQETFFELGGHSLLATQILFVMNKTFCTEITLQQFFNHPTVDDLAALAAEQAGQGISAYTDLPEVQIALAERYDPFPLTDVQKAYWIGRSEGLELGNVSTHMYFENDVADLNLSTFQQAFQALIERHDMLRSVILPDGQQQILPQVPSYIIRSYDITAFGEEERSAHVQSIREEMSHQVLDCCQWPLFDVRATRLPEGRVRLHISVDLLIADAWSLELLLRELSVLYLNPAHVFEPLTLSFRDYVLATAEIEKSELFRRSETYWKGRLDSLPMGPQFELVKEPSQVLKPEFRRRQHVISAPHWKQLKKRAEGYGITSTVALLSAFSEVLTLWSRKAHFALNLTLFNRLPIHPEVGEVIGDFTSLTLLEIDNREPGAFISRAQRHQRRLLEDMDHRYFSGVRVTRELLAKYKEPSKAIVPVIFTSILNQTEQAATEGQPAQALQEDRYSVSQTPQVWLDHQVLERDGELHFNWDSVDELFPAGMLDEMFAAYCGLLDMLAKEAQVWDEPLPLSMELSRRMPHRERLHEVATFHTRPLPPNPSPGSLLERYHNNVRQRPSAVALIASGLQLSYSELNDYADYVAGQLILNGTRPGEPVAVVMHKGWEQIAAVLGILKAGCAYLPVDASLPQARIAELLRLGQVANAVIQPHLDHTDWPQLMHIVLNGQCKPDGKYGAEDPEAADRLAYIMFTSGSTGVPKGVMVNQRSVLNTIEDILHTYKVGPHDVMFGLSALNFDLSVFDIFGMLSAGGTLVLPDKDHLRDPAHWLELMNRTGVTLWNTVPALLSMLTELVKDTNSPVCSSLRLALLSGDWIPLGLPQAASRLKPGLEVVSLGGATEAAIWSIAYPVQEVLPGWTSIPYGRSLANQRVYVLNERMEECPIGVCGELYIGGEGLAMGYWQDELRTLERFIRHPLTGQRLYRTGDLGRYAEDGNIEFLGREDLQIKVHGHRIELGEIEAALKSHPYIKEATVISQGEGERKRLSAYVTVDREQAYGVAGMAGQELITGAVDRMLFKLNEPALRNNLSGKSYSLGDAAEGNDPFLRRRSYRSFVKEPISQQQFGAFTSALSQRTFDGLPFPKFQYGSAGGLYPVQVYFHLKPGAVEDLPGGLYYYNRKEHQLVLLEEHPRMDAAIHAPGNREVFEASAFQIFLIGCMDAIVPMYGQKDGLGYSMMEAGIISQLLEDKGPEHGIGLIQMGTLGFEHIRPMFRLRSNDVYLHCLLGGGITPEQMTLSGQVEEMNLYSSNKTTTKESKPDIGKALTVYLKEKLPSYMVPSAILELENFPLTANGKVDRKALALLAPQLPETDEAAAMTTGELPSGSAPLLQQIADAWRKVLNRQDIGLQDNFFDLGGDSISMVALFRELQEDYGSRLTMIELFRYPTIKDLCEFLLEDAADSPPQEGLPLERERADSRRSSLAQLAGKQRQGR